jgi:hypothetical protein
MYESKTVGIGIGIIHSKYVFYVEIPLFNKQTYSLIKIKIIKYNIV